MSEYALDCIVCGAKLKNVWSDCENQPSEGTTFTTTGHYGSTAFDPMDGTHLEINVCDGCLTSKAEEDKVLVGRQQRPIVAIDKDNKRVLVGWDTTADPHVHWRKDMPGYEDDLVVNTRQEFEEVYQERDRYGRPKARWDITVDSIRNLLPE